MAHLRKARTSSTTNSASVDVGASALGGRSWPVSAGSFRPDAVIRSASGCGWLAETCLTHSHACIWIRKGRLHMDGGTEPRTQCGVGHGVAPVDQALLQLCRLRGQIGWHAREFGGSGMRAWEQLLAGMGGNVLLDVPKSAGTSTLSKVLQQQALSQAQHLVVQHIDAAIANR